MQTSGAAPTDAEIDAALERVLAGPAFHEEESAFARFFEWVRDWLSFEGASSGLKLLYWIVLITAALLLVALIVRGIRAGWRARATPGATGVAEDPRERALDLCRAAADARRAGDLRLALRLYVAAVVLGLGQRGEVEVRDAWTNRELLARGAPGPRALELLLPLVRELEPAEFGRAAVRESDVERLERVCDELLAPGAAR